MTLKHILFTSAFILSINSNAAIIPVEGTVTDLIITPNTYFGGCMVKVQTETPIGGNCKNEWISFSCSGDFNTPQHAYKMLDLVQMNMVLKNNIRFYLEDRYQHNGYCVAVRTDIAAPD